MRVWKTNPKKMCRQHLLGEHAETHMFAGCIRKGKSVDGYVKKGLVEIHNIRQRHGELAKEMKARGYKHKSPLPKFCAGKAGRIDAAKSERELSKRCRECRKMMARRCAPGKTRIDG